ncbi:MAG: hypothetical protein BJ554DRAFT_6197, partial [Olpidium bornovanus]
MHNTRHTPAPPPELRAHPGREPFPHAVPGTGQQLPTAESTADRSFFKTRPRENIGKFLTAASPLTLTPWKSPVARNSRTNFRCSAQPPPKKSAATCRFVHRPFVYSVESAKRAEPASARLHRGLRAAGVLDEPGNPQPDLDDTLEGLRRVGRVNRRVGRVLFDVHADGRARGARAREAEYKTGAVREDDPDSLGLIRRMARPQRDMPPEK